MFFLTMSSARLSFSSLLAAFRVAAAAISEDRDYSMLSEPVNCPRAAGAIQLPGDRVAEASARAEHTDAHPLAARAA